MDAKMASLNLDTKQKEKVFGDMTTLPELVLEKIISNLDFYSRTKLSTTNNFFGEFVPTVMLKLDSVEIDCYLNGSSCFEMGIFIEVRQYQGYRSTWNGRRNEEDCLRAKNLLEKLLNNKMVKVDRLRFLDVEKHILSIFPKKISCQEVLFFGGITAEAVEEFLKRMNINMEKIRILDSRIPESILRLDQMRTADCIRLDLGQLTSSLIYECIYLKKVDINVIEFVKGEGRVIIKSSIRDLIERWRNINRQQLREMKIQHHYIFSYNELVAEIPDLRMTSYGYELEEETNDGYKRGDFVHIHKNCRIDKISTDSTVIGHANIDWNDVWKVNMDRLSEQMKTRLRNGVETIEEIPLDDGILTSLYESVFTVTFEDYP